MSRNAMLCLLGTGTDVGKTVTTSALLGAFSALHIPVQAIKPVQTGCLPQKNGTCAAENFSAPDVETYQEACPCATSHVVCALQPACSPHLAARLAGVTLNTRDLAQAITAHTAKATVTLVEGAGGVLTPLNEEETLADCIALLHAPVLLVVPNQLGAVNHALLSLEALRARAICVTGFVLVENSSAPSPESMEFKIRQDNKDCIERMGNVRCFGVLPFCMELQSKAVSQRKRGWVRLSQEAGPIARQLAEVLL